MEPRTDSDSSAAPLKWVNVLVTSIVCSALTLGIMVLLMGHSEMALPIVLAFFAGATSAWIYYRAARRRKAGGNPAQMEPPG